MSGRTRVTTLALIGTAAMLVSGPVAVASAAPAAQAKWTVMVYMSGDNNLEDYIVKDLELELGGQGIDGRRPDHRPRRSRARLRQEPRRLADHQALPPDPGHGRGRRERRRRLGREEHGRPGDAQAVRVVVEDQLPGRPLRAVLLGPWLRLAPGLGHGRRLGQRRPRPARGQGGAERSRVHRRRGLRRLQYGPDRDHVAVGRPCRRARRLAGVREHGRDRVRHPPHAAQREPRHERGPGRGREQRQRDRREDVLVDGARRPVHHAPERGQRLVDRPEERAARRRSRRSRAASGTRRASGRRRPTRTCTTSRSRSTPR